MVYYAVKKGINIGIYSSWSECQQQTSGFKGAIFKKFDTFEEASEFISGKSISCIKDINEIIPTIQHNMINIDKIIYVDGGFNKVTGDSAWGSVVNGYSFDLIPYAYSQGIVNDMELKEVQLPKGKRVIIVSKFNGVHHQNNGAELLALVVGLRIAINLIKNNIPVSTIYSDSQVVLYWSIRLKNESAATFDPRKVSYIHELIYLRRTFESMGGKVEKVDGDKNPADLGWH